MVELDELLHVLVSSQHGLEIPSDDSEYRGLGALPLNGFAELVLDFDSGAKEEPNAVLLIDLEVEGHANDLDVSARHLLDVLHDVHAELLQIRAENGRID